MSEPVKEVPTLDSLVADPARVFQLSPDVARLLLGGVSGLLPALIAQSVRDTGKTEAPATPERWLDVEQAAKIFNVTERWLKTHKHKLPHSKPSHKVILFPEEKLRKWFAAHKSN
ncbi:MAG: helix-turn-helix domain-containing protein [Nitrospira sp.]|nr:helix-turn-helix domain-containing protein [Nitrospira sp.]MDH4245031.1 helix-turn-helix domain-containing protein [Nitrospira sp.]MDH4355964.1 helix-turn-helix domain-containing protein [Nitrospira sp.]MDH5319362.1 helix-turn-helix domain-containing protein [Nitrospira sp.]